MPDKPTGKTTQKRKAGAKSRLPQQTVLEQRNVNKLSITQIAKLHDVAPSTIYRFLEQCKDVTHVEEYKRQRADILTLTQAQIHASQAKLRKHLLDDAAVEQMSEEQKRAWHHTLSIQGNMAHTQERLERGQSTSNTIMDVRALLQLIPDRPEEGKIIEIDGSDP